MESSAAREAASPVTGQQLLASFVETGRQEPFEEIVRRYAGMVYNTCLRVTKSQADAEDASQAVFLTLALQVKKGTEIKALGPWLQQVAKRLSLDSRRGGKRRRTREQLHHEEQTWRATCTQEEQLPPADLEDIKSVLHEELNKLPSKYRLPLVLHYFGGLSREEMAEELGCKPSTLGVRIFRARALLAERLSSRGVDFTPAMLPVLLHHVVRGTVSRVLIGTTARAAAAFGSGQHAAGLVSNRVIALTRRAAAATVVGKLKLATVAVLVSTTLLLATARALCSVERVGLRDFLDRQVQSLVRPLLEPFSLPPLRIRLSQRSVDGFDSMLPHWTRMNSGAQAALAAGWRFGPLVPWQPSSDSTDLLTALDNPAAVVPNVFASLGGKAQPTDAESLADAEQDLTTQLLDPDDEGLIAAGAGGDAGDGGAITSDAAESADDGQTAAADGGADLSGANAVSFHLPAATAGQPTGGGAEGLAPPWSFAHADNTLRSSEGRSAAAPGSAHSSGTLSGTSPRPSHGGPPGGMSAQNRRHPSVARHGDTLRTGAGNGVWNLGRSTKLPSGAVPLRHDAKSEDAAPSEFPSNGVCVPEPASGAVAGAANAGDLPAATETAGPIAIGEIASDAQAVAGDSLTSTAYAPAAMQATPTAELANAPELVAFSSQTSITPEPTAVLLFSGAAGIWSLRRRR